KDVIRAKNTCSHIPFYGPCLFTIPYFFEYIHDKSPLMFSFILNIITDCKDSFIIANQETLFKTKKRAIKLPFNLYLYTIFCNQYLLAFYPRRLFSLKILPQTCHRLVHFNTFQCNDKKRVPAQKYCYINV